MGKSLMRLFVAILLSITVVGCQPKQTLMDSPDTSKAAEFVFTNGKIYTGDLSSPWVSSIGISGGKLLYVGDDVGLEQVVTSDTERYDLKGNFVLPGLHDQHVHALWGGLVYSGIDQKKCIIPQGLGLDNFFSVLEKCISKVSESEWVTGGQWDVSALGVSPHRELLDKIAPNVPVLLEDTSGHGIWVNSLALKLAGVDSNTVVPAGGVIELDALGEPTGILWETATDLVRKIVPLPSDEVLTESLVWSLNEMLSNGITSFTEASNGFIAGSLKEVELYSKLAEQGILKQRVRLCLNWNRYDRDVTNLSVIENRKRYASDRLHLDCVKIFLDGVPTEAHTAAMLQPYAGTSEGSTGENDSGSLLLEQSDTNEAVIKFDKKGLSVKFHAAGDAAVRSALDAVAAAYEKNRSSIRRHSIGHSGFIAKSDLPRANQLGVTFEMSPYLWAPSPIADEIIQEVGVKRIERAWPVREAIDAKALVIVGSDWSVVPSVNPWMGIETLVSREKVGGSEKSFGKSQAISVLEAINLFTVNAAKHMNIEDRLGRIATGMIADLIVVDRNPFEIPVSEIHKTQVILTMIEGEVVYQKE